MRTLGRAAVLLGVAGCSRRTRVRAAMVVPSDEIVAAMQAFRAKGSTDEVTRTIAAWVGRQR